MRWQPALRTLPPYHDDPAYIAALADSVRAGVAALDFVPDAIVASFHGMPQRTLELGDPYHCHCRKTARLLVARRSGRELIVAFQSRFGRAKWLEPATDATLAALPGKGVKRIAVVTPGFSADCLETLEEIAIRGRDTFRRGRRHAFRLPALPQRQRRTASQCCEPSSRGSLKAGCRPPRISAQTIPEERHMTRVAIVTGGTRGIGEAISIALQGARA